jgi:hypothetical protein
MEVGTSRGAHFQFDSQEGKVTPAPCGLTRQKAPENNWHISAAEAGR